ncbi:hypothetical protein Plec18170_009766 [Paecilomyces lecythidis]
MPAEVYENGQDPLSKPISIRPSPLSLPQTTVETGQSSMEILCIEDGIAESSDELLSASSLTDDDVPRIELTDASKRYENMIPILIAHGVTLASWDTPLMAAASDNKPDLVCQLLQMGADPNEEHYGNTPLEGVVQPGFVDVLKVLLDHGAIITARIERRYRMPDLQYQARISGSRAVFTELLTRHAYSMNEDEIKLAFAWIEYYEERRRP